MRYNVSDINDLMTYIQQRYPNLLSAADENGAEFNDGDKIYFTGDQVLESMDMNVVIDPETNQLKNTLNPDQQFKYKRFEFLFDYILMKIHNVNPEDNLTKTKKSIPYISLYMSGVKMPFIIYLFSQYGIMSTLNRVGVDYIITEDRGETGDVVVELAENKFLVLRPETIRERLLVNGLLVNRIKYPIVNLDSPEEIHQHIIDTYGENLHRIKIVKTFLINPLFYIEILVKIIL